MQRKVIEHAESKVVLRNHNRFWAGRYKSVAGFERYLRPKKILFNGLR